MLWGGCCGGCCAFGGTPGTPGTPTGPAPCDATMVDVGVGWIGAVDDGVADVVAVMNVDVGVGFAFIFTAIPKKHARKDHHSRHKFSLKKLILCQKRHLPGTESARFGCVFLTWRNKLPLPMNAFPHWLQLNGFSPVWDRRCDTKCPLEMKSFGQRSQRNGRSAFMPLLWLRLWNRRFPFNGNDLPHSSHSYGRSPVWQRLKI